MSAPALQPAGSPLPRPLVLIHGLTSGGFAWAPLLADLGLERAVTVLELPGHIDGPAITHEATFGVHALVDHCRGELDRLGIERADLVGNSLGGWIALQLAAEGRAHTVTCLAPAGGWRAGSIFGRLLQLQFRAGHHLARLLTKPRWRWLVSSAVVRHLVLMSMVARPGALGPAGALRAIDSVARCEALRILLARAGSPDLYRPGPISCPTMVAWSRKDRLLISRRARQTLLSWLPGAQVVSLPGVGHVPMSDDPALVARVILTFTEQREALRGRP